MSRLGKVQIVLEYVVDLDDTEMADEARDCMWEDICDLVRTGDHEDYENHVLLVEDEENELTDEDIPEFLRDSRILRRESVDLPEDDDGPEELDSEG